MVVKCESCDGAGCADCGGSGREIDSLEETKRAYQSAMDWWREWQAKAERLETENTKLKAENLTLRNAMSVEIITQLRTENEQLRKELHVLSMEKSELQSEVKQLGGFEVNIQKPSRSLELC